MNKNLKRFVSLFIICLLTFLFVGCNESNNNSNDSQDKKDDKTYTISLTSETDTIRVGEELELIYETELLDDFIWSVDDDEIATIDEFGYITALQNGEVEVMIRSVNYPNVRATKVIYVTGCAVSKINTSGINYGIVGDTLTFKVTLFPKGVKTKYTITSDDESIARVNKDNTITLNKLGVTNINIIASDDGGIFKYVNKVYCVDLQDIYVDCGLESHNNGDEILNKNKTYYYGYSAFSKISEAGNKLIDGSNVFIANGTYEDKLTIKKNNVTITSNANPIINGLITLVDGVKNVTIENLKFINNGGIICNSNNENILIQKNIFTNVSNESCIKLIKAETGFNNISITENKFEFLSNNAIELNSIDNLKITQNNFKNIEGISIYFNNPSPSDSSQWLIKANMFEDCTKGIESRIMSSAVTAFDTIISIFDNTFDNLDSCINLDGNNNGTVTLDIRYNDFMYSKNLINLDTVEKRTNNPKLYAVINYNNMIGDKVNSYITTTDQTINNINFENNFYCTGLEQLSIDYVQAKSSSNIKLTVKQSEKIIKAVSDKLYGKSALFTDEETVFVCKSATSFTSSNNDIVTIDDTGKVVPVKEGTATIYAYRNSLLLDSIDVKVFGELQVDYASELLKVAFSQEGYHEGANNLTKYGQWYAEQVHESSFANGAWCAMFVSWCADQANIPTNIIPLYASCTTGRSWFETRGLFKYKEEYKPKAGDIIFFLSDGAGHTGIVISCNGSTVYTIEGNTSDMCAKRSYNVNYHTITGYGTPNYPKYEGKQTITFDVSNATDGSNASTR